MDLVFKTKQPLSSPLPIALPAGGTYPYSALPLSVTLLGDTGTTIFYTDDGTDPTTSSTTQQYSDPITISSSPKTLNFFEAYPLGEGWDQGPVKTEAYTFETNLYATIPAPTGPALVGQPILVTATFHNEGPPIYSIRPETECIGNVFCEVTDLQGNPLPPSCLFPTAYGIPNDRIQLPTIFYATCDLTQLYPPEILVPGSYKVKCIYSNQLQDPDWVDGQCLPGKECYPLSAVAIPSNEISFDIKTFADVFKGFFLPVDNPPVVNKMNSGRAVPLKFSLQGNRGLDIFAAGYPASGIIACDSTALADTVEETVTAGGSSLQYDPASDQYTYVWKTDKSWARTCRQLLIKFIDGSVKFANFNFTK
jgi:hypothetical protein